MIVPERKLLQVERKPSRGDTGMVDEPFPGPTPEVFETVDAAVTVVNRQVTAAKKTRGWNVLYFSV
jgi:hypothetical protein